MKALINPCMFNDVLLMTKETKYKNTQYHFLYHLSSNWISLLKPLSFSLLPSTMKPQNKQQHQKPIQNEEPIPCIVLILLILMGLSVCYEVVVIGVEDMMKLGDIRSEYRNPSPQKTESGRLDIHVHLTDRCVSYTVEENVTWTRGSSHKYDITARWLYDKLDSPVLESNICGLYLDCPRQSCPFTLNLIDAKPLVFCGHWLVELWIAQLQEELNHPPPPPVPVGRFSYWNKETYVEAFKVKANSSTGNESKDAHVAPITVCTYPHGNPKSRFDIFREKARYENDILRTLQPSHNLKIIFDETKRLEKHASPL